MQQVSVITPAGAAFPGQNTTYTGTAGTVTGWGAGPTAVLVTVTTPAYVVVGAGVTATTADTYVPASTPIPFAVPSGAGPWTVSAIQVSSGGSVYAKPLSA